MKAMKLPGISESAERKAIGEMKGTAFPEYDSLQFQSLQKQSFSDLIQNSFNGQCIPISESF